MFCMSVTKKKKGKKKSVTKKLDDSGKLNINHKRFCQLYTQNSTLFGNATQCYAIAYGYDLDSLDSEAIYSEPDEEGKTEKLEDSPYEKAYNVCKVEGHRLLTYPNINEYINKLLNEMMTNETADAELAWVMKQRVDLAPKLGALREFNKLKNRVLNIEINTETIDPKTKTKVNSIISNFLKDAQGTIGEDTE